MGVRDGTGDGGGEGDEGLTVGDGEPGGGGEGDGSDQLTLTAAPPGPIVIVPCPDVLSARVMSTVTTSCCPAAMVPPLLLSVMSDDDVTADQVTGPPLAVSRNCPVEPVLRTRLAGETCSRPRVGWPAPWLEWPGDGRLGTGAELPRRYSRVGPPVPWVVVRLTTPGVCALPLLRPGALAGLVPPACPVTVGAVPAALPLVADDTLHGGGEAAEPADGQYGRDKHRYRHGGRRRAGPHRPGTDALLRREWRGFFAREPEPIEIGDPGRDEHPVADELGIGEAGHHAQPHGLRRHRHREQAEDLRGRDVVRPGAPADLA